MNIVESLNSYVAWVEHSVFDILSASLKYENFWFICGDERHTRKASDYEGYFVGILPWLNGKMRHCELSLSL